VTLAWGPGPFDNDTAQQYISDLFEGREDLDDLGSLLEGDARGDIEFAQEQYAAAALVAEAAAPDNRLPSVAVTLAGNIRVTGDHIALAPVAKSMLNRMLNDPYAPLWQGHEDGGIGIRRQARVLRARLHRACSS
jgi:hypothetical protein